MIKICTIIGARPQFIKAAAVSAEIAKRDDMEEVIIHTGQHYDAQMSKVFFDELGVPPEKYNLAVGSASHGRQTGRMLEEIETILFRELPDWVLLYGDTNSTVAGALAAVKLHLRIAHVEAGMRSFNKAMPEEINRIVTDHCSTVNFCSSKTALQNLTNENLAATACLVGDVMADCTRRFSQLAETRDSPLPRFGLTPGDYLLLTCHRAENTDDPVRLGGIVEAVNELAKTRPVLYPAHPRTRRSLADHGLSFSGAVRMVEPVGYLDMLVLLKNARLLLTDSGGMQKEAFFLEVPCVTLRDETEWVETVDAGMNRLAGTEPDHILAAAGEFLGGRPAAVSSDCYGDGFAAGRTVAVLRAGQW